MPAVHRPRPEKWEHLVACGELYAAYAPFVEDWHSEKAIGDLVPDCTMVYNGITIHFEVDRGNEQFKKLEGKIERYIRYCGSNEKTVFVLDSGWQRSWKDTGHKLHGYLATKKRGRQFSWTPLTHITYQPMERWLFNDIPEQLSINELCK